MRDNVQADGPEDYFRKSITLPFLDYMLNEMKKKGLPPLPHASAYITVFLQSVLSYL